MNEEYFKAEKVIEGYAYPSSYVDFVNNADHKVIDPWWLIGSSKGLFDITYRLLNINLASSITIIPFAKDQETNALAFFDRTGNVYCYCGENTLENIDWEKRFHFTSFNDWLKRVKSGDF